MNAQSRNTRANNALNLSVLRVTPLVPQVIRNVRPPCTASGSEQHLMDFPLR